MALNCPHGGRAYDSRAKAQAAISAANRRLKGNAAKRAASAKPTQCVCGKWHVTMK